MLGVRLLASVSQNVTWRAVRRRLRHPVRTLQQWPKQLALLKLLFHNCDVESFLHEVTRAAPDTIRSIRRELGGSRIMSDTYARLREAEGTADAAGTVGFVTERDFTILYSLVRLVQPEVVVETGVASGASSVAILSALQQNGKGGLISIDLPPEEVAGKVLEDDMRYDKVFAHHGRPGWVIPEALASRWRLVLGDVRHALPSLLQELQHIDIFVHDDLHTPEHMFWEFETVWPHLSSGGVLAADDVNWGWTTFLERIGYPAPYRNCNLFGAVVKQ